MVQQCHNCGSEQMAFLYAAPGFDTTVQQSPVHYNILRCAQCDMANTELLPGSSMNVEYSGEYYGSATGKFLGFIESFLLLAAGVRAKRILRLWRRSTGDQQSPSVLDIGCGRALLLRAFQSMGATVLGLERAEFPIADSNSTFVCHGSLADAEYASSQFDIVVLWHVLEHVEKQELLMDEITRHLNPGGLLVLAVPNFASLQQRLFTRNWFHLDLPRHLVHIKADWLTDRLCSSGYTIEGLHHIDLLQNTYGFIQSSMNRLVPRRQNAYYRFLKQGGSRSPAALVSFCGWSLLAAMLLPVAVFENFLSAILGSGATIQVLARRGEDSDQR
ncbi:MAG: SAM-dependent methyltransferase [Halieaceae bacterium]|jgi:SAM-dependent methyltransferase